MPRTRKDTLVLISDKEKKSGGVEIKVRFPTSVFDKLCQTKQLIGAANFTEVFKRAIQRHLEILKLVKRGHRIFATRENPSDRRSIELALDIKEPAVEIEEIEVTKVRLKFSVDELQQLREIQKILQVEVGDTSTPLIESIASYCWMVDKKHQGFKAILIIALKSLKPPSRSVELKFDEETLLLAKKKK
jgi:hypothetical protein